MRKDLEEQQSMIGEGNTTTASLEEGGGAEEGKAATTPLIDLVTQKSIPEVLQRISSKLSFEYIMKDVWREMKSSRICKYIHTQHLRMFPIALSSLS